MAANVIMASSKAFLITSSSIPSSSTTPKLKSPGRAQLSLPKISLPKLPKPHQLPSLLAAASLARAPPSLAEEIEKAALFDFNLTLPIIALEFLFLMFALDKIYYTPLGKFMDERDAMIREKLSSVKDTSEEVKQLEEQAAAVMRAARAEISAALNKMKKETQIEVEQKLAEGRKKIEAELQEALANLERQKEETVKALDSQIAALSQEIVKKGSRLLESLHMVFSYHPSRSLHHKGPMTMMEKCYSFTLLPHASEICRPHVEFTCFNKHRKKSALSSDFQVLNASSLSSMKLLLMCGFFTLQSTQQAIAGTDIASSMQSFDFLGDLGDISSGFASAFLLIFFSELGDKTFFIAALLAARNSAAVTFIGTFGALAVMTIISVVIGRTFHYVDDILPFRFGNADLPIDDLAAVCLLIYFGITSLLEASSSDGLQAEEQQEAELAVSELSGSGAGILATASTVFSTFLLVFVAEWGDKSFFSTIALAAASSPLGVIAGALAGHGAATLLAVLGGSFLGTYLSEKAIGYIGGTLFLVFAAVTLIEIVS